MESQEIRERIGKALQESQQGTAPITTTTTPTGDRMQEAHDTTATTHITVHAAKYVAMNRRCSTMEMILEIDPAPFCINELTSLNKIQYMYSMLGLGYAWIVNQNRLKGVLTKRDLIHVSKELEKYLEE